MPSIAEQLSSYATNLRYEDLPSEAVHQAKRLIIDTIGCAAGGYDSEPSRIAFDIASSVTSGEPATILVSNRATSPDLAAFANGVMIRYLDFNDGYTSRESGHPSDTIAATLAATEVSGGGGKRLITSTVLAYEVFCRICDAVDLKPNGFDHVTVGCIASTLGAARGLGLSEAQTNQAINLGVAPNLALYQTRIGEVSMWKGCSLCQRQPERGFCRNAGPPRPHRPFPRIRGSRRIFHGCEPQSLPIGQLWRTRTIFQDHGVQHQTLSPGSIFTDSGASGLGGA